jgi:hypothetical protein
MTADDLKSIITDLTNQLAATSPGTIEHADVSWRLGSALQALSDHGDTATHLRNALAAYQTALDCCPAAHYPQQAAAIRNERGTAYRKLAAYEDTLANINRSIVCHREAARLLPHDSAEYARTQTSIGNAYQMMAGTGDFDKVAHLLRAINAYERALNAMAADTPDFAATQNNLGLAYARLAQHNDKAGNMQRAINAHLAALRTYDADTYPLAYAQTQRNLGIAYEDSGRSTEAVQCWEAAAAAYDVADAHAEAATMRDYIANVDRTPTVLPPADAADKFPDFMRKLFRRD